MALGVLGLFLDMFRTARRPSRAFTMLEMCAVFVCVSVLLGIALFTYQRHIDAAHDAVARAALVKMAEHAQASKIWKGAVVVHDPGFIETGEDVSAPLDGQEGTVSVGGEDVEFMPYGGASTSTGEVSVAVADRSQVSAMRYGDLVGLAIRSNSGRCVYGATQREGDLVTWVGEKADYCSGYGALETHDLGVVEAFTSGGGSFQIDPDSPGAWEEHVDHGAGEPAPVDGDETQPAPDSPDEIVEPGSEPSDPTNDPTNPRYVPSYIDAADGCRDLTAEEIALLVEQGYRIIEGTNFDDTIVGTDAPELIFAGNGEDTVDGGGGADIVFAGTGRDMVAGGDGEDIICGDGINGNGADELRGGAGDDIVSAGNGPDTVYGGRGSDVLYGGRGPDVVYGGDESDHVYGSGEDDTIYGGASKDTLYGGPGTNNVYPD